MSIPPKFMDATTLETIARWSGGTLVAGDPVRGVSTVCTDSRALKAGDLFLAGRQFYRVKFRGQFVDR